MFRRDKAKLGGWPAWCDVPLAGAYAIVSGGGDLPHLEAAADVAVVGGLGTWRLTQGVYRYDSDLFDALWTTPIERVPVEMLYRLPEWCVYLETKGRMAGQLPLRGAFVWLEHDSNTGRSELRALLDAGDMLLLPLILHLSDPMLDVCIDAALGEALRHMPAEPLPAGTWQNAREYMRTLWPPIISLALYLCSVAPDVMDERGAPGMPARPQSRKKDGTIIAASAPKSWVIGSRIGQALRKAAAGERAETGLTHASPRTHVRRAHWHTYLVGTGRASRKLRWLHPILVSAGADLPVTIHPVEEQT
jgi:hypothetical protein